MHFWNQSGQVNLSHVKEIKIFPWVGLAGLNSDLVFLWLQAYFPLAYQCREWRGVLGHQMGHWETTNWLVKSMGSVACKWKSPVTFPCIQQKSFKKRKKREREKRKKRGKKGLYPLFYFGRQSASILNSDIQTWQSYCSGHLEMLLLEPWFMH